MKLSVLIPSVRERASLLSRLLYYLTNQAGINEQFEILVHHSAGLHGDKIDTMIRHAVGTHIVIVDDDDWVAPDYMQTVLPLLDVDFVGYKILSIVEGRFAAVYVHDAQYSGWKGTFRGVCQKMPIRKELAALVPYGGPDGHWYWKDWEWADRVQQHVESSRFVDRELYFHDFSLADKNRSVGRWPYDASLVRWM